MRSEQFSGAFVCFARRADIAHTSFSSPKEGEADMETVSCSNLDSQSQPWNKGKLAGAKPPLRPKYFWAIRTRLQLSGRLRDLALFNLGIDSKLRGCDIVGLKLVDVAPHGYAADRASVPIDDYLSQPGGTGPYL